jgi:hypothetical protein
MAGTKRKASEMSAPMVQVVIEYWCVRGARDTRPHPFVCG